MPPPWGILAILRPFSNLCLQGTYATPWGILAILRPYSNHCLQGSCATPWGILAILRPFSNLCLQGTYANPLGNTSHFQTFIKVPRSEATEVIIFLWKEAVVTWAENSKGLGADKLSWLGTILRLGQRWCKARWTARSLLRGNR